MLTPTPLIYCPTGIDRPACCAHRAPIDLLRGKGPDAVATIVNGQEVITGGGGKIYGASGYDPATREKWRKTRAGWWLLLLNHKPQDLIRLQAHPRVRRWAPLVGAQPEHTWHIPILLEPTRLGWMSALDGIWDGESWSAGELARLQEPLLAIANGVQQGDDATREADFRRLAIDLLALGHLVDEDLLIAAGWLSESLMLRVVLTAAGRDEDAT